MLGMEITRNQKPYPTLSSKFQKSYILLFLLVKFYYGQVYYYTLCNFIIQVNKFQMIKMLKWLLHRKDKFTHNISPKANLHLQNILSCKTETRLVAYSRNRSLLLLLFSVMFGLCAINVFHSIHFSKTAFSALKRMIIE